MTKRKSEGQITITRAIQIGALSIEVRMTEEEKVIDAVVKDSKGKPVETLSPKQFKALQEFAEGCNNKTIVAPIIITKHCDHWAWPPYRPQITWGDHLTVRGEKYDYPNRPGIMCQTSNNTPLEAPDAFTTAWKTSPSGDVSTL